MNSSAADLLENPPVLRPLFRALMDALSVTVEIDDFTELVELLRTLRMDDADSPADWLADHPDEARRLRESAICLAVNEAAVRQFSAKSADELVQHMNATVGGARSPDFLKLAAALRAGATEFKGTFYREALDGQLLSSEVETRFIRAEGRILACHVVREPRVVQDLEDQLIRIRQLHSLAVSATDTGCWDISYHRHYIKMDATCHRLLGYEGDDELPTDPDEYADMIHPEDRHLSLETGERLASGQTSDFRVTHRLRDASGTWRWFRAHGCAVERNADGRVSRMVGTFRLVDTEWKTDQLLRLEKEVFAVATTGEPLSETFAFLCQSLETIWPGTHSAIHHYDPATRLSCAGAAPNLPPEFVARLGAQLEDGTQSILSEALSSQTPVTGLDLTADSRCTIDSTLLEEWRTRHCWMIPAIAPDGRCVAALSLFAASSGAVSPEDVPLLEKLTLNIAILVLQNQHNEQQRDLEHRLQVQDKFQSLGKLAGGIAHDFNNLLTVISGQAQILEMQLIDNPAAVETAGKILHAAQLAASLCRQMMTFAGQANVQFETIDLNDVAHRICKLLQPGLPGGVDLQVTSDEVPAMLQGDDSMLSQLVMNLVSNAAEAGIQNNRVRVTVSKGRLNVPERELMMTDSLPKHFDRSDRKWVCLTVSDTGSGISPETRERMFDPFYTTKESGKGLGLATVMGIIRRHQGTLHLDSNPGSTTFRIYLPERVDDDVSISSDVYPDESRDVRSYRILLTDDDSAVRNSVAGMLEAAGFETHTFSGGNKLLDFADSIATDDVILLDQNMPGLKGSETYDRLRARGIRNPVCFVTAYGGTEPLQEIIRSDSGSCILEKPIDVSTVDNAIRRLTAHARV